MEKKSLKALLVVLWLQTLNSFIISWILYTYIIHMLSVHNDTQVFYHLSFYRSIVLSFEKRTISSPFDMFSTRNFMSEHVWMDDQCRWRWRMEIQTFIYICCFFLFVFHFACILSICILFYFSIQQIYNNHNYTLSKSWFGFVSIQFNLKK